MNSKIRCMNGYVYIVLENEVAHRLVLLEFADHFLFYPKMASVTMTSLQGANSNGENTSSARTVPALADNAVLEDFDKSTENINSDDGLTVFSGIVKNFSTVWLVIDGSATSQALVTDLCSRFTICMDTGVLSIILHQFPYPSHWTRVCSTILFVTNIVLFLNFSTIYLLKWTRFRKITFDHVRKDCEEIALQACPAITWLTLVTQVQLTCAQSWGYGFTILAFVMWWIGLVCVLTVCVLLYLHMMKHPSGLLVDRSLPTAVFIPIVGLLTVANTAGVIINNSNNATHLPDSLAIPLILVGFICVGFAIGLGLVMYAIYSHRLFTSGWPSPLKIPAMILTVFALF